MSGKGAATAFTAGRPPWRGRGTNREIGAPPRESEGHLEEADREIGAPLREPEGPLPLLEGLKHADAFELDERFRRALSMEQRLEARIGPFLALVWERWVYRALGYTNREAYARERLGMDPTRARALVRLERSVVQSESFARAYKAGALSWVKASVLAPLVSADPLGWFVEDWLSWAGQVTVRRLREDVEQALALSETDPEAFRQGGGLPPELRRDREIGAARREPEGHLEEADPRIRVTKSAPEEGCTARFFGPADVVQLFRAVLCTVR